eukprot:scaffold913_cov233-Pinguiococcus_pyrenoidosus.AAC.16
MVQQADHDGALALGLLGSGVQVLQRQRPAEERGSDADADVLLGHLTARAVLQALEVQHQAAQQLVAQGRRLAQAPQEGAQACRRAGRQELFVQLVARHRRVVLAEQTLEPTGHLVRPDALPDHQRQDAARALSQRRSRHGLHQRPLAHLAVQAWLRQPGAEPAVGQHLCWPLQQLHERPGSAEKRLVRGLEGPGGLAALQEAQRRLERAPQWRALLGLPRGRHWRGGEKWPRKASKLK